MKYSPKFLSVMIFLMLLGACSTRLGMMSPHSVNLSGTWVLDQKNSQTVMLEPKRERADPSAADQSRPPANGDRQGRNGKRILGWMDLPVIPDKTDAMQSTEMTIEQGDDSIGIAYLNAVYRDIDWGEKKKGANSIIAGWRGETLIVETKTEQLRYSESYALGPAKDVLILTITVQSQSRPNKFVRVFTRKS